MSFLLMWLPNWAWQLIGRHFRGFRARPAVRWMNRFAVLGLVIGVFAWTAVVSIMDGLQGDIRGRILKEKAHLLWEGTPVRDLQSKEAELRSLLGDRLSSIKWILQTEALLEVHLNRQLGRVSGSGVVLQGIEGMGEEIAAGYELMNLIGVTMDEPVRLHSAWKIDQPALEFQISKVFESGVYDLDRSVIRMDRKRLESWLGLQDSISRIEIQMKEPLMVDAVQHDVAKVLGREVKTWKQTDASLWYSLRLEKVVMAVAVFFIVLIAAFAVHLALSVRVADKTREIALLRALGADDKILSRLYLTEGALLGVLGAFVGLLLSRGFCFLISGYFQLPTIYYLTTIPVDWNWWLNIFLAFVAVILAVLASWWPSRKVRDIEVQEALRS